MTYRYSARYRTWYRPSRGTIPRPVAIGAAVLLALGAADGATQAAHHHHAPAATVAAGSHTPRTWAPAFLRAAGLPRTVCDRAAVVAWEAAEGGHWGNSATYNPLDTTLPEPGSHPINSVGVQAYTSWRQGLVANAVTIRNGYYPGVLAALEAGGDAQAVAGAVARSPWGTSSFTAEC